MFEFPISNNNHHSARGQRPQCADTGDVMHGSQFIAYPARSNVPTHERQVSQKKNGRPTEIAESRRRFIVISPLVEPWNNGPNAKQKCNQQPTDLRAFQAKELQTKF